MKQKMTTTASNEVTLVQQHPDHAQDLYSALNDPSIYTFLDQSPPKSVRAVQQRIARQMIGAPEDSSDVWLNWSVLMGKTIVGYTHATIQDGLSASLACVLSPDVWGTGIALRAAQLTMSELTNQHGISKWIVDTDVGNIASQKLLNRLGFIEDSRHGSDIFYVRGF